MGKRRKKAVKSFVPRKKSSKPKPRKSSALEKALRKVRALQKTVRKLRKRPAPKPKPRKRPAPPKPRKRPTPPKPRKRPAPKPRKQPAPPKPRKRKLTPKQKREKKIRDELARVALIPQAARLYVKLTGFTRRRGLVHARQMTLEQIREFLREPTRENLENMAGDTDNDWYDEDGDRHNPFWYH